MDLKRLYEILSEATIQLRKGEEVEERKVGNLHVTEIYAMPHESEATREGIEKVDVHFVVVGVDREKAEQYKKELVAILKTYPQPERLAGGPSYIEVGAEIGDQGAALQLFALGKVLGLWNIITPEKLGLTGDLAREMAGAGYVMIEGVKLS